MVVGVFWHFVQHFLCPPCHFESLKGSGEVKIKSIYCELLAHVFQCFETVTSFFRHALIGSLDWLSTFITLVLALQHSS